MEYESEFGNSTTEALGQGREGACQGATKIVEELDAFAVISETSQVFTECASERGLMTFAAGAYASEDWYQEQHPYAWHLTMSCTVIADHVAEYLGKRLTLADDSAEFAGGSQQGKTRKFGTYIPDIETYLSCNDRTIEILEKDYGVTERSQRITYALDISRFAEQAQRAILQFKADGVTTIILAADPFSVQFLTAAAREQEYSPEWIIIGSAAVDTDNFGRSYDQESVDGHIFGVSQLPQDELLMGPDGEAGRLYEKLTGETIRGGTTGSLNSVITLFNFLQAAGPDLTPENVAAGAQSLPVRGDDVLGVWSWHGDHTGREDAREVYWDADSEPSPRRPTGP
ncbi:MAG: ABC transporter substrate-binding protein [Acidimicrobiia bacterium]|nr:ABC transporter substrate-binding protein [Acidimicrobiia bacterium]